MRDAAFNAFVVACLPIAESEVWRLKRRGVPLDIEDAVQGALLDLIENRHVFKSLDGALARCHIRHRLINAHVVTPMAKKRRAFVVPIDDARNVAVEAHEDSVIEYVDAHRILAKCPMPPLDGGCREARHQRRERWKKHVRRVFKPELIRNTPRNDNTDQTPIKRSSREAA